MEPAGLRLPELDPRGDEPEAGPERRPRDGVAGEPGLRLSHAAGERLARGQCFTLTRGPGADLALARARREIGIGLGVRHADRVAGDSDLAFERRPEDAEARGLVGFQVASFGTPEVGEE